MSEFHTFEVFLPTMAVGGRVVVDGQELRGVADILISGRVGELTKVVLHLHAKAVTVHGATEHLTLLPAMADITGLDHHSRRYGPVASVPPGTKVDLPPLAPGGRLPPLARDDF